MTVNKKRWVASSIILVVFLVTIGYCYWNKPGTDVANIKGLPTNAVSLYGTFTKDSLLAKKNYISRVMEVAGVLSNKSVNLQKQTVILIKTGVAGANINCTMEGPTIQRKPGDSILIKGICSGLGQGDTDMGLLGDVYLIRCYELK